ncbi:MAG: nucleoside-diphosphate kinase [Bacteroidetes bacterium]|nr:nucleoside-diphosphate kinase [Bacteroidota bacterium]MBL0016198.1 nucleoside-diphosphate kinase [Bacteroidota bacterium]MBP6639020.1 nucleoside-diphosphate kinase [Bacteroidia bacterium]MBP6722582.1 nucleoside-diphosphate kinase [Bacteroidia bacterium]MBP8073778.1 nucleoside-diphosphate kinase [Bacteroidia bacterium]
MSGKLTFTIIKPDAVRNGHAGKIIDQIIEGGFKVRAMKMVWLSDKTAGDFYDIHRERSFFKELVDFMTSGPCIPMILEKDNAVEDFRTLIGATNPANAAPGTIRNRFAKSIDANAIHGSDSDENALREGSFFFASMETF